MPTKWSRKEPSTSLFLYLAGRVSSPWWEGFELFIPVKHPNLFEEHVMCLECSTFRNNPDAGIVKIGISQLTSNLRSHKKHHHSAEYKAITKGLNKDYQEVEWRGIRH